MSGEEDDTEKGLKMVRLALIIALVGALVSGVAGFGLLTWTPSSWGDLAGLMLVFCGLELFFLGLFILYIYLLTRGGLDCTPFSRQVVKL